MMNTARTVAVALGALLCCAGCRSTQSAREGNTDLGWAKDAGYGAGTVGKADVPTVIDYAVFYQGVDHALALGGAAAAASYILATLHVDDSLVSNGSVDVVLDVDLFDAASGQWILGDGQTVSLCTSSECCSKVITSSFYDSGGRWALRLDLTVCPQGHAGGVGIATPPVPTGTPPVGLADDGGVGGAGGSNGPTAGSDTGVAVSPGGGSGGTGGVSTSSGPLIDLSGGKIGTSTATGAGAVAPVWPPAGFVNVTNATVGAYALGPEITSPGGAPATGGSSGTSPPATACAALFGVVRDFKMGNQPGGHPDFETAPVGLETGIVATTLGSDGKPVYATTDANSPSTTGPDNFNQWYNDVPGVNISFVLGLHFPNVNGTATFSAIRPNYLFPLDNQGFGNEGQPHNFAFTTEIHTAFTYKGGETFAFAGDDDVWVFIDKRLVIDLGGRHAQTMRSVAIDSLGLTLGDVYEIAIFQAERHTDQSNYQIQTTLAFANCGEVDGVVY